MPRAAPAKRDLIDDLCEAIQQFGNAVADWQNFRERKPEAPQTAEAAKNEILDLWARLRNELTGKPGVALGDLEDLRQSIRATLNWGRRLLPINVTLQSEDTGEERPLTLDRDDPQLPTMLTDAYDLFAPVPEVDPTDLNDPLKFAQFYFVLRDRLQALRPFLGREAEGGTPDAPSGPEAPAKTYTVAALRCRTRRVRRALLGTSCQGFRSMAAGCP